MCVWSNTSDSIVYSQTEFPFLGVTAGNLYAAPMRVFPSHVCVLSYSKREEILSESLCRRKSGMNEEGVLGGPGLLWDLC